MSDPMIATRGIPSVSYDDSGGSMLSRRNLLVSLTWVAGVRGLFTTLSGLQKSLKHLQPNTSYER